mmetsp:Transcript_38011/g.108605  ORF Transcript_38011/g.108605 Transcript_38011/m.108605 type:complete len:152 (+) Transcript_38011:1-456(+)
MGAVPPLADLPPGVDAVAEMNGLFWVHKGLGIAEGYFPQMSQLRDLVDHYSGAHFILNVRDPARWLRSVDGHNDLRQRLVCAELPGLAAGKGAEDAELLGWVAAHHQRVEALLARRRSRLLVFDIERHGERELSDFLGRKVVWGQHNVTTK